MHLSKTMALAAAASTAVLGAGILARDSTGSSMLTTKKHNAGSHIPVCFLGGGSRIAALDSSASSLKIRASSSSTAEPSTEASTVKEMNTSIQFPRIAKFPGASKDLTLLGLGVLKVYAVGFYVDQEKLAEDPSLKDNIAQGKFEKALRIVLARDIDGALFSSALDEELKPRMRSDQQALVEFGNVFKDLSLKKGTAICFTWAQPSTLHVGLATDGTDRHSPKSSFASEPLASALFDVYLGDEKPVSPSLKSSIAEAILRFI